MAPTGTFSPGTLPLIVLGARVTKLKKTSLSNEPAECPVENISVDTLQRL